MIVLRAGGDWGNSYNCGSRARAGNVSRSFVNAYYGCRVIKDIE